MPQRREPEPDDDVGGVHDGESLAQPAKEATPLGRAAHDDLLMKHPRRFVL